MESVLSAAPWYVTVLFYFGVFAGAVFVAFGLCALMDAFLKWVKHLIYIYKYKHRFNKSPIARCYCKDCDNWNPHSPQATAIDYDLKNYIFYCWVKYGDVPEEELANE